MNYISEIRGFYDLAEQFTLSSSCICLWHALMFQANKARWKEEFSVAISTLELRTGLKRGAIYTARNTLQQHGIISVRQRDGQQSALYTINTLCLLNEHNTDANPNATQTQHRRKPEPLNKQDIDEDVDETKEKDTIVSQKKKEERNTIPPSLDMVEQYCLERGNGISASYFIDFYTSKGWMIGKNKMKDWQSAIRTWEKNRQQQEPKPKPDTMPEQQTLGTGGRVIQE